MWPSACTIAENVLWGYHGSLNILFKYNLESNESEYLCSLKDEETKMLSVAKELIWTGKGIYVLPLRGKHIHFYNFEKCEDEIITIPNEKMYWKKMTFSGAKLLEDKIIVIPHNYQYIISIDINENKASLETDILEFLSSNGIREVNLVDTVFDDEGVAYSVIGGSNMILKYEIKSKKIEIVPALKNDIFRVSSISIDGNYLFLGAQDESKIIVYDKKNNIVNKTLDIPFDNFIVRSLKNGAIIVDSIDTGSYYVMNKYGEYKYIKRGKKTNIKDMEYPYSYGIVVRGNADECLYYDRYSYSVHKVDSQGNLEENGERIFISMNRIPFFSEDPICENESFSLPWFLNIVKANS